MKNKEIVKEQLDNFINSEQTSCLVVGTNWQNKHKNIIGYLNTLNKKLKILIRIPSMQDVEYILGIKAKSGTPIKLNNLTIYVDSFQKKSQEKTHKNFNSILLYPADSLKGMDDDNINDILNNRNSEKIFWISNHDNVDFTYLEQICNIKHIIEIDTDDDIIHKRILDNKEIIKKHIFDKIHAKSLNYGHVEEAINNKYNLGGIYTSGGIGQELMIGSLNKCTFGGYKSTKTFIIKVLEEKDDEGYILLTKMCK